MTEVAIDPRTNKQARRAWYFYDFGNSAYAAVILLAVFSNYFTNGVVGDKVLGPTYWNYSLAIAGIIVAVLSPILGTIADFSRAKKKFLLIFTVMSVVFTMLLFFVQKGDVLMAVIFFILAEIGYRAAQVFYDALLVDVSTPRTIASVSADLWALGMLGGIICLGIVLVPIQLTHNNVLAVRLSFVITGLFYALSSIPTFLRVRQISEPEVLPGGVTTLGYTFKQLGDTFRDIRSFSEFVKYTIAFLIYNDGIMMLMDNAALIGGILYGFQTTQLIILIIILHVFGAAGAYLFGRVSSKYSSKQALIYALIILMAVVSLLFFLRGVPAFYVIGALAGFALSGVQAVSRTMVSQLSPANKTTEFYGFLSVAGRTSTFIGPLVFGSLYSSMATRYLRMGKVDAVAHASAMYWAIGSILVFLLVGLFLLLFVRQAPVHDPLKIDHVD
mgnify:CR=1 FL=1